MSVITQLPGLSEDQFIGRVQTWLTDWLNQFILTPELKTLLLVALQQPGQLLATHQAARKSRLVRAVWQALSDPSQDHQLMVELAASLELLITASDVIDDLQDGRLSYTTNHCDKGQWLNVALWLLFSGQSILDHLVVASDLLNTARRSLHLQALQSVQGQFTDLAQEQLEISQLDAHAALEVSALKSGSVVQGLFESTAILAGAPLGISRQAGEFGTLVGVIRQLVNDLNDLLPQTTLLYRGNGERELEDEISFENIHRAKDISRYKKTLPIVFALNLARRNPTPQNQELLNYYSQVTTSHDPARYERLNNTVRNCGSGLYVELVLEMQRKKAQIILDGLVQAGYPGVVSWTELLV